METYKCFDCASTFTEADRDWDVAVNTGRCPRCHKILRDFPQKTALSGMPSSSACHDDLVKELMELQAPRIDESESKFKSREEYEQWKAQKVKENEAGDKTPTPDPPYAPRLINCPYCTQQISSRADKCPKCGGAKLLPCAVCSENIAFDSTSCPKCGDPEPFPAAQKKAPINSTTTSVNGSTRRPAQPAAASGAAEMPIHGKEAEADPALQTDSSAGRWPRFFARVFDVWWEILLLSVVFGAVLGRHSPVFAEWMNNGARQELADMLFGMLLLPIALMLDATLYRIFGNTPGKALLGLRVEQPDGSPLSYGQYLGRNFSMWLRGLALGIPIVGLFTMARQANRLAMGQPASYDEPAGYSVHAVPINLARKIGFGIAFVGLLAVNVVMGVMTSQIATQQSMQGHATTIPQYGGLPPETPITADELGRLRREVDDRIRKEVEAETAAKRGVSTSTEPVSTFGSPGIFLDTSGPTPVFTNVDPTTGLRVKGTPAAIPEAGGEVFIPKAPPPPGTTVFGGRRMSPEDVQLSHALSEQFRFKSFQSEQRTKK